MKIIHTMIRVKDMDASIRFYTEILGMKLFSKDDYPGGEFSLAFVGYGDHPDDGSIELTYNWGKSDYDLGDAFGHIALGVQDIYGTCDTIKNKGGEVVREPGPMKHGTTVIAFVKDPNGYMIELIQR
ncbi:lactoylglutathione lyase [Sulfidibacter corallicola]|uniref:lactoylglutathione lyase n=1 Tax=Sulfidibacter corallicola TaxID=2818388 RepID=A0A8A4TU77_SULCO|nr:lactoylglutathione lyase [Sulfidibacter corallicola]QTD52678.1 lactoylglutathione lyase [Sulfidibacter corallicola]